MRDHQLQRLLRDTAERLEPPTIAVPGLAARVRTIHQRSRRRRQSALGVVASLIVVGFVGWQAGWWTRQVATQTSPLHNAPVAEKTRPTSAAQLASLEKELAEIDSQLRIASQVKAIVRRDQQLKAARREAAQDDALETMRMRLDIVAYQMLQRADELRIAMLPGDEANAAYRNLIELFPHTRPAAVAQSRLAEMRN